MAAFAFKAMTLSLKTLAKPLAERFKSYVLSHPTLRPKVVDLAQSLHRMDVKVNRGVEGRGGRAFVGDLTEEKAMELAGKVVSEGFVYTVAIGLLALEVARQTRNDGLKKEKEAAYQKMLDDRYREEIQALKEQRELLDNLAGRMEQVENKVAAFAALAAQAEQQQRRFWGLFSLSGG